MTLKQTRRTGHVHQTQIYQPKPNKCLVNYDVSHVIHNHLPGIVYVASSS